MADISQTRSAGFTLIEVLVAFSILAVSFAVLFEVFGSALDHMGRTERERLAILLARSKLAEVGLNKPLQEGEDVGRLGDEFDWHIVVNPGKPDSDTAVVSAHPVRVTVHWKEGASARKLTLETLRLKPMQASDGP